MRSLKLLFVAIMIGLGVVSFQAPAQAATNLGGISMDAACDNQRGTASYAVLAKPVNNNVHDWRCRLNLGGSSSFWSIDTNRECRRVHGSTAYAGYLDYSNAYSWRCFRP